MNGRTTLVLALGLSGCWWSAPSEPEPPTDEALHARCYPDDVLTPIDTGACWELARRHVAEDGPTPEVVPLYKGACVDHPDACVELGLLYLEDSGLPRDPQAAEAAFGRGCSDSRRGGEACGWRALLALRGFEQPDARSAAEGYLHTSCAQQHSGWPCTNYGVALACGYFGAPDVSYARHVLDRGCTLGDGRACTVSNRLQVDPTDRPACTLIGPDPDHPVDLALDLRPGPPDLQPDPEHQRRWRAPMPLP